MFQPNVAWLQASNQTALFGLFKGGGWGWDPSSTRNSYFSLTIRQQMTRNKLCSASINEDVCWSHFHFLSEKFPNQRKRSQVKRQWRGKQFKWTTYWKGIKSSKKDFFKQSTLSDNRLLSLVNCNCTTVNLLKLYFLVFVHYL